MYKSKLNKNAISTELVSENIVTVCYAEPIYIDTYRENIKLKIFDDDTISLKAIKYSSDTKIYLISYVREKYNKKQKAKDHPIIVLFFNGRHLAALDVRDNIVKTFFLDRINKIMIDGKTITLKKFLLSNGFKYKLIFSYLRDMSFTFVVRLIIQNIKIRVRPDIVLTDKLE
jgi:hypothetical protein